MKMLFLLKASKKCSSPSSSSPDYKKTISYDESESQFIFIILKIFYLKIKKIESKI